MSDIYLVTGGTGYVGSFVILQLLEQGATVRTSLRSLVKERQLRESLYNSSDKLTKEIVDAKLSVFRADLTSDDGWAEIFEGVTYVLHVASPFPATPPDDPEDLIIPARQGTVRILSFAAKTNTVKHVVITSSFAAIGAGHPPTKVTFNEEDWTDIVNLDRPYTISKTLAEKAAWEYVEENKVQFGLTVLNPVLIIGPSLKNQVTNSTSLNLIKALIDGSKKDGVDHASLHLVDVRDVAKLHIQALTTEEAIGERFIVASGPTITWLDAAEILRSRIPKNLIPNLPLREVGTPQKPLLTDISKVKRVFKWTPIPNEESLAATVEGILERGDLGK
ncbi:Coumarine and phenylpropanoid biosynthesis [Scheffersomyces xylosifermentans]|uniref:Coumarine and phenylpropanoid biosynthesis n=1 Tax=Scheffersomyces xylosifermentans TaxID=1304137 RepID=UPI00315DE4A8